MHSAASAVCVLVLALMWSHVAPNDSTCPGRCQCSELIVQCRGCPVDLGLSNSTQSLIIIDCIIFEEKQKINNNTGSALSLMTLEIINSSQALIATLHRHVLSVESLTLRHNNMNDVNISLDSTKLKCLDLSNNNITLLRNSTFEKLRNLLHLNINLNKLNEMEEGCFNNLQKLTYLDLSQNNLTRLRHVLSNLTNLQQLNLSYNNLKSLSDGCFNNLSLLQHLDISNNQLTKVAPGALQYLPNLARLFLADNPKLGTAQLDGQLLVSTGRRLQQVDASRTGLSQVPEALTQSVRFLALVGNKICKIECGDLDSYPLLQTLDFSENTLRQIEDDALGRLEMLSELHLNRNKLQSIPKMLPDELQYLSMSHNLLGNISISDFVDLPNLKVLLLGHNLITYIQENVFIQSISLEVLDLSSNPIVTLTPSTFNGPLSLKDLKLSYLNVSLPAKDASFPVPSPEWLQVLQLDASPGLARQLLADSAVLAAMSRLQYIDLRFNNINVVRTDLLHYLPQLKILRLQGNNINCTSMNWLRDWMINNVSESQNETCYFSVLNNGVNSPDILNTNFLKIFNLKHFKVETKKDGMLLQRKTNSTITNSMHSMKNSYERKKQKTLNNLDIDSQNHNDTLHPVANKIAQNKISSKLAYIFGTSTNSKQTKSTWNNTENENKINIEHLKQTSESYNSLNISRVNKASMKIIESNPKTRINQENAIRLLDVSFQQPSGNSERDFQALFSIAEKSTKEYESTTESFMQVSGKNAKRINKAIVKNISDITHTRIRNPLLLNTTSKDNKDIGYNKTSDLDSVTHKAVIALSNEDSVTKENNYTDFTKGEWSPYSAEKIHSSAYQYTAIVAFVCIVISACGFAWWSAVRRRSRQPRQIRLTTPPEDHIEVSSISGGSGLLW